MTSIHHHPDCQPWTRRRVQLDGERLRVLVVDDNTNAAHALAMYLGFEDIECRLAYGGAEAVQIATDWLPHAIAMDISMPGCNGFQAATALRANARTCGIAIIAFTALDETEVRRYIVDHEFDGYCQKGKGPNHLVSLIMHLAH